MTDFAKVLALGHKEQRFLSKPFYDSQVRITHTRAAGQRRAAPELIPLLFEQNSKLPESPGRTRALNDLTSGDTAFVITGQQTGLFLGPLFTLYKALSAIRLARKLQDDTGVRTIPLFWLQSEDHDFAEINQCVLPNSDGALQRIALSERTSPPRSSVEYEIIRDSRDEALSTLQKALLHLPHGPAVMELVESAYRSNDTIVSAFAAAFATLLREEELLFFDPRDQRIASLASPIYRRALTDYEAISQLLQTREQELYKAGFEAQVHIRASSPLFFFHPESPSGERYRITRTENQWQLVGTDRNVSDAELSAALETNPLKFSSSALLRPIVQEHLFPSAGYVGGAAEVNYFAQIDPLFDYFSVPRPIIYPRASFRCVDAKSRRLLDKLGLSATSATLQEELAHPSARTEDTAAFDSVVSRLKENFDSLVEEMQRVDQTLKGPTEKTAEKLFQQVASLRTKYSDAVARSRLTDTERTQWLSDQLFPTGIEQERVFSCLHYVAKYGTEFISIVKDSIDPFNPLLREIQL